MAPEAAITLQSSPTAQVAQGEVDLCELFVQGPSHDKIFHCPGRCNEILINICALHLSQISPIGRERQTQAPSQSDWARQLARHCVPLSMPIGEAHCKASFIRQLGKQLTDKDRLMTNDSSDMLYVMMTQFLGRFRHQP